MMTFVETNIDDLCTAYIDACKAHNQELANKLWKELEKASCEINASKN